MTHKSADFTIYTVLNNQSDADIDRFVQSTVSEDASWRAMTAAQLDAERH